MVTLSQFSWHLFRPLFPRWYKVQDLINDGKLKFEDLDRPAKVKNSFRKNVEMTRQKKKTSNETNFGKAAMPKEKVPIAKI